MSLSPRPERLRMTRSLGESWETRSMRPPMVRGIMLFLVYIIVLFLFIGEMIVCVIMD